ncbi:MAG: NAD(P)/FAD-dependent oxidoreductase [Methanothrix sp.]|nr:NAD(P)/FAD-dependent oxidoreductase [Methanothrix sp.]
MAKLHKESRCKLDDVPKASGMNELLPALKDIHSHYDLIIVGAGPSGLFCAINSMQKGKKILILEKKNSPGHKLLISGTGQCNITHDGDIQDFLDHYGDHGRFLRPALLGFTNSDLIAFFKAKGLEMIREKGDKIFPETKRSRDVLDILIEQCREWGVFIKCNQAVKSITRNENGFLVGCDGVNYRSRLLVIATGGCSYPATGSCGDGYRFASVLGHRIVEIGPALTPLLITNYPFSDLAGLSFPDMKISLYRHAKIREHRGDILFTHEGLSGPGILDLSRYIRAKDILKLSFVPDDKRKALEEWLVDKARLDGARSLLSVLADRPRFVPSSVPLYPRLIKRMLQISGIATDLKMAQLTREMRSCLIDNLVGLSLVVSDLCGYSTAMVTRGGVETMEVDPKTMQSRLIKGLYLVGEVLDVDGDTGGYNLQAAFSTGMLAARSIKSNILSS